MLTNITSPRERFNTTANSYQKTYALRSTQETTLGNNPLDPNLAQLNNEITSDIQHHKTALWKSHLDGNWDHRENTHTLWKTLKNLSNKNMHTNKNHTISFNNKPSVTSTQIANSFNKQLLTRSHTLQTKQIGRLTNKFINYLKLHLY